MLYSLCCALCTLSRFSETEGRVLVLLKVGTGCLVCGCCVHTLGVQLRMLFLSQCTEP